MDIFPAQYSTLSSKALQNYIAESYKLAVTRCKYHLRGVSDTYIVFTEDAKFIFKVYRSSHCTYDEIEGEIELLNLLKAEGVNVAWPVPDNNGDYIQKLNAAEGERYGVLFIFAPGKTSVILSDSELNTLGYAMARIHNITAGIQLKHKRIVYDIETTLINPIKTLEPAFVDFPEGHAYLRETAVLVEDKIKQFDGSKFSYGYCHYDLLPKNFHFDTDGSITFFDFDWVGKGYLVNDVMTFFFQYYWLVYFKKMTYEDAEKAFGIFVAAYRQVRPLSDSELKAIPYLWFSFMLYGTAFQYEHYDDFSNQFFNTRYLKDRVEMIRWFVERYCTF
ncbi:MAG TPA: phosphotransferase [Mucilaginibacter sp.]|jgi:Ser/Thr protein kinase RdoA (MazF antagonist)